MVSQLFCLVMLLATLKEKTSAGHVARRSDDSDPYAAVISEHSQKLTSLEARMQSLQNLLAKRASFRVLLNKPVIANAPIRFDQEFNLGGGHYDPNTGTYTVATPGVYSLSFQLFPSEMAPILADLYVNGVVRIRSRCYDSGAYSTSCAATSVFRLQQGDKLWMQADHGGEYYYGVHNFLSGFLVSPDP